MTKRQLTEYDGDVLRLVRRLSLAAEADHRMHGRVFVSDLRRHARDELGIALPRSPHDGPLGRLIERGEVVMYSAKERYVGSRHGNGTGNVVRAASVDDVTLGALMRVAAEAVDPGFKGSKGRKGHSLQARSVERISPKQFDRVRTMARRVAYHIAPTAATAEEAYEQVGGIYLCWDPAAGMDGDWRPMYDLIRSTRARDLENHLAAAKTLLDLGATHGFLLRAPRSSQYVIPTAWATVQAEWVAAARHPGIAAVLAVNHWLGAAARVLGPETDLRTLTREQVERMVERVESDLFVDRSLRDGQRQSIRRAMRRIMNAGLVPEVAINGYDYRQRHARTAWSAGITQQIAATMNARRRSSPDPVTGVGYEAWRDLPYRVLADPNHPYSLARVIDYHCAKGRERDRRGFRGRGFWPDNRPARGSSSLTREYWSDATVRMRLGHMAMYIGWVRDRRLAVPPGTDRKAFLESWMTNVSLADLLTPELLEAYVDDVLAGRWSTPDSGLRTLVTIGLMAAPCLQTEAQRAGDVALAGRFFDVACLATGLGRMTPEGHDGRPLYTQVEESDNVGGDRTERQKKAAKAVEDAYRNVLNVDWAFDGMARVYVAALTRTLRDIGVQSVAELQGAIKAIELRPTDAERLRALSVWNLHMGAPLRTSTSSRVELAHVVDRGRAIHLDLPSHLFKRDANGPYSVELWRDGDENGFDVELLRYYVSRVRLALLNPGGSGRRSSTRLWVNSFARGKAKHLGVLESTLNSDCKTVIRLGSEELGFTADQTAQLLKVGQIHSFRHSVAGRLVAAGRMEHARILLHHRGYDTLLKVYAVADQRVSTGLLRGRPNNPDTLEALVDRATPAERARLLRILGGEEAA
jgi:hypothetical protein